MNTRSGLSLALFDLCSGSGEPAVSIFRKSGQFKSLTLSDKFPDLNGIFDDSISYIHQPTDVLNTSFSPNQTYTMFNAFHHFGDTEKIRIVKEMTVAGAKGFFVEILSPGLFNYLKILFATTVGTLLLTPFILPFSLKRLLFTYIIPVNILTITFDGFISVMKSRSVNQYQTMFKPFKEQVEVFEIRKGLSPLIVIEIK
jgi:hypothetical protein